MEWRYPRSCRCEFGFIQGIFKPPSLLVLLILFQCDAETLKMVNSLDALFYQNVCFILLFVSLDYYAFILDPNLTFSCHIMPCHAMPYKTPQTYHDGRFYELKISCPDSYPAEPPIVKFISKVNMTCVDPRTGVVQNSKLPAMRNWNRNLGIEQVLTSLRREMCSDSNRKLRQPAEGLTF